MNALCHKPNPPPQSLQLCLRKLGSGPDADQSFVDLHNTMLRFCDVMSSRIIDEDDRHQHVELKGDDVANQKQLILEALSFLAHGNWEITEGGEPCQDPTT